MKKNRYIKTLIIVIASSVSGSLFFASCLTDENTEAQVNVLNGEIAVWDGTSVQPNTMNVSAKTLVIDTPMELAWVADRCNDGDYENFLGWTITLNNSLDLSGTQNSEGVWSGTQWIPIGTDANRFKGFFDGSGKVITGLFVKSCINHQGLFGYTYGGWIKNLTINGYVRGSQYAGGLVGFNAGADITNCTGTVSVNGKADIGGLVGCNGGTLLYCVNHGPVNGANLPIGGIAGSSWGATLNSCSNFGNVTGESFVGGVLGYGNTSVITGCSNSGTVTGTDRVGGIVGVMKTSTMNNCTNTGIVNAQTNFGDLFGYAED